MLDTMRSSMAHDARSCLRRLSCRLTYVAQRAVTSGARCAQEFRCGYKYSTDVVQVTDNRIQTFSCMSVQTCLRALVYGVADVGTRADRIYACNMHGCVVVAACLYGTVCAMSGGMRGLARVASVHARIGIDRIQRTTAHTGSGAGWIEFASADCVVWRQLPDCIGYARTGYGLRFAGVIGSSCLSAPISSSTSVNSLQFRWTFAREFMYVGYAILRHYACQRTRLVQARRPVRDRAVYVRARDVTE